MPLSLRLRNFKGVKEGDLNIYPFTILMGANNSAKTTVLEALFLLPNPLRDFLGECAVNVVKESHSLTYEQTGATFLFNNYTSREASIALDGDELKMYRDSNNTTYFSKPNEATLMKAKIKIDGNDVEDRWLGTINLNGGCGFVANVGRQNEALLFNSYVLRRAFIYFINRWIELANSGILQKVAKEMSSFSSEKYSSFTYEPFVANVHAMYAFTASGIRVRVSDLGEGMQVYVAVRLLYSLLNPKALLWDDVEAHVNPKMLVSVAGWLNEVSSAGVNVVVTTHSLEAAEILAKAVSDAKIVMLYLENGKLKSKEMEIDEVEELKKAGIDIRFAERLLF